MIECYLKALDRYIAAISELTYDQWLGVAMCIAVVAWVATWIADGLVEWTSNRNMEP